MSAGYLDYTKHDQEGAQAAWARSKKYAQDALALAPALRDDPGYGTAIYGANIVLGTHALREGDRASAVRYMLAASKAPASPDLTTNRFGLELRLVNYLLKAGERESVIEFLEHAAEINGSRRDALGKDA